MDTREALVAAIAADLNDDLPRLVMADWFEENGEPERAEFVRLQIHSWLQNDGETFNARNALAKELMHGRAERWFGPMLVALDSSKPLLMYEFTPDAKLARISYPRGAGLITSFMTGGLVRRGFVGLLTLNLDVLPAEADVGAAFRAEPVDTLIIQPTNYGNWPRFSVSELSRVRSLGLGLLLESDLHPVFRDPHLSGVRELVSHRHPWSVEQVVALVASPLAGRLKELSLMAVNDAAVRVLSDAEGLALDSLHLGGPGVSARGVAAIANATFAGSLRSLDLSTRLDNTALITLVSHRRFTRLTHLELDLNHIGEPGLVAFAAAEFTPRLEEVVLKFRGDRPDPNALGPLADALRPEVLKRLRVNNLGDDLPDYFAEKFGERVVFD